jgi:hypothetical protein
MKTMHTCKVFPSASTKLTTMQKNDSKFDPFFGKPDELSPIDYLLHTPEKRAELGVAQ